MDTHGAAYIARTILLLSTTMNCPHCRCEQVVKAGRRKLKTGAVRQLYRCNGCCRRFSGQERHGKRTSGKAILRAVVLVCRGCSYDEAALAIKREFGVSRSKACISRWVSERSLPYLDIRERLAVTEGPLVRSYLFTHNGLNYPYQLHLGKLAFAKQFPGLVRYLKTLPDWLDHSLFAQSCHCSQMRTGSNPGLKHYHDTMINQMAAEAIPLAATNPQRHNVLEDYFLAADRNTIACEVPVYYRHKQLGLTAGHIDLLQVSSGKVQILDYKPNAASEQPAKVVSQLTLYAEALSRRTKVPLDSIRCGYFDEHDAYYFRPATFTEKLEPVGRDTAFDTYQADRQPSHGR